MKPAEFNGWTLSLHEYQTNKNNNQLVFTFSQDQSCRNMLHMNQIRDEIEKIFLDFEKKATQQQLFQRYVQHWIFFRRNFFYTDFFFNETD